MVCDVDDDLQGVDRLVDIFWSAAAGRVVSFCNCCKGRGDAPNDTPGTTAASGDDTLENWDEVTPPFILL